MFAESTRLTKWSHTRDQSLASFQERSMMLSTHIFKPKEFITPIWSNWTVQVLSQKFFQCGRHRRIWVLFRGCLYSRARCLLSRDPVSMPVHVQTIPLAVAALEEQYRRMVSTHRARLEFPKERHDFLLLFLPNHQCASRALWQVFPLQSEVLVVGRQWLISVLLSYCRTSYRRSYVARARW